MQSQVQYEFAAEPQLSHPKYRDQDFYEELTDLPDDESKIRPDYYIDRPPTPEYRPLPKGIDVATQIEAYEPDLFDYKLEVEPVLQVLVGKSVEQARMELIEESEAEALRQQKAAFEKRRNAELMVTQRMEAAYMRRKEERERRILQHKLHCEQMKLSQQKFIARQLSKGCLRGVNLRILRDLENLGFLKNDHLLELKIHSLPWLVNKIQENCDRREDQLRQFALLLDEIQLPAQNTHAGNYQKEMDRRRVIQDERERVRIEIEQRKLRKAEIKRRRAIKEKREIQRQALYNNSIAKAEAIQTIFQATIHEAIAEPGQKGLCLPFDFTLLLSESLSLITGDQLDQLDEQIIQTIWMDILQNKVSALTINMNAALQAQVQDALQKMEDNLLLFEKEQKARLIEELASEQIWASFVSRSQAEQIRPIILKKVLSGLFEIYFKSVNYKEVKMDQSRLKTEEQQQQQAGQDNPDDQGQPAPVQEEAVYEKPEITQHDLDMVEARKKINIVFRPAQQQLEHTTAVVNLLVPYFVPEEAPASQPPDSQREHKVEGEGQAVQEEKEPEKPVGKWDFDPKTIDIYDGEQPLVQEGTRGELDCLYQYQFLEQVLVNDERALELGRLQMYQYLKEKLESFMNVPEEVVYRPAKYVTQPPIYDYEL